MSRLQLPRFAKSAKPPDPCTAFPSSRAQAVASDRLLLVRVSHFPRSTLGARCGWEGFLK